VLQDYPEVNTEYRRVLYLLKSSDYSFKRGVVLPSLLTSKKIKMLNNVDSRTFNVIYASLTNKTDIDKAVFFYNTHTREYSYMNPKG